MGINLQIKNLFEKNLPVKVIARTVHKRVDYVRGVIKIYNLKRQHLLKKIKRYCIRCNKEILRSDVYKYCSRKCFKEYEYELYIKRWLAGDVNGTTKCGDVSNYIRKWLFEKNKNKCEKCGWSEINPVTEKIPLTINHKDGNSSNSNPKNIELICPNCHSLTSNYGSLNKGKGRKKRLNKLKMGS